MHPARKVAPGLYHHDGYQRPRIRYQINCDSDIYRAVQRQCTATERINSQAKELGIERPRLRNGQAIANLNTLIYVLINLRALHRVRRKKADRQSK